MPTTPLQKKKALRTPPYIYLFLVIEIILYALCLFPYLWLGKFGDYGVYINITDLVFTSHILLAIALSGFFSYIKPWNHPKLRRICLLFCLIFFASNLYGYYVAATEYQGSMIFVYIIPWSYLLNGVFLFLLILIRTKGQGSF